MTEPHRKTDPVVVDLYKMATEMADRISVRRATANAFFLTTQTTFVAVLGIAMPSLSAAPIWIVVAIGAAGLILSASWWLQLRSYRELNAAKFRVINTLEEQLPVKIFADEWEILKQDPIKRWRPRYAELGAVERTVPWLFSCLYLLLIVGRIAE
ncbi:RipA family octameric membrane protein [Micromonospora palythoicola]|uniref:RipA family octameric membrane protein n=1 Tax=Micromonospora palythoicola TaxID=3120507 RepID=UPI002FCE2760